MKAEQKSITNLTNKNDYNKLNLKRALLKY